MTAQEIKDLISDRIKFYNERMNHSYKWEYAMYHAMRTALTFLQFDIKRMEEYEKCRNNTGPQKN